MKKEKERAIIDKNSIYYALLETCLQRLHKHEVLRAGELSDSSDVTDYRVYYRTNLLLSKVCPAIIKEPDKMHDINRILDG